MRVDAAVWVDVKDPFLHYLDLRLADCRMERDYLPVDIRERHAVAVDYIKAPDADPCKRFAYVAPDASGAENGNARLFQFFKGIAAEKRGSPYVLFVDPVAHLMNSASVAVSSIGIWRMGAAVLPALSPERLP